MAELKKGDKEGLGEDDEDVQVILFENASEFRLDQFTTENETSTKPNQPSEKGQTRLNGPADEGKGGEHTNVEDLEGLVKKATKEKKVFMKYDYTNEKMWEHSNADKSMWFNYNFDEHSFKAFVQNYINNAIAKQANYQIENTDAYENETHHKGIEHGRSFVYTGAIGTNENEYVQEEFNRKEHEESYQFYRDKEFSTKDNNRNNRMRSGNKILSGNIQSRNFKTLEEENNSSFHVENIQTQKTPIGRNQVHHHQRNGNQRNIDTSKNTTNVKNEQINDIPLGTQDLMQLQNLINFFKQNPNT